MPTESPTATARAMFVNLPVTDLPRATAFFGALGFGFDERFTDERAACMVVGDGAYVMLLTREFFGGFTRRGVADAAGPTGAIVAVTAGSREECDRLADAALRAGATEAIEPIDHGFMYSRSFHDPDGHMWELVWMDMEAAAG